MSSCKVFGCRNSKMMRDAVTVLYAFPKNEALRFSWHSACANPAVNLSDPNLAICANHFTEHDFLPESMNKGGVRQLKYGTLPTVNLPEDAYSDFPEELPVQVDYEPQKPVKSISDNIETELLTTLDNLSQLESLKREVKILRETTESQAAKLKVFHSVLSRSQVIRIFQNPKTLNLSAAEVEEAVRRHEAQAREKELDRRQRQQQPPPAKEPAAEEEVIETFNEYTTAEDEEAVDRYVLPTKLIVTRLKTS